MRWKCKPYNVNPKEGDMRVVRRFLLIPTCIGDEWRWMEMASIKQMRIRFASVGPDGGIGPSLCWTNMEWVQSC